MKNALWVCCLIYSSVAYSSDHSIVINSSLYNNTSEHSILYNYKDIVDISDSSYLSFDTEFFSDSKKTTNINPKELKYQFEADTYGISLGYDTVFWGVSEVYNPVDIINRKNNLTTYKQKDKLGEFMLGAQYFLDESTVSGYILPRFEHQKYLTAHSIRGIHINTHTREKNTFAVGLRYSQIIDDFDIGLSYFSGANRDPQLTPVGTKTFNAYYAHLNQVGLDVQYTTEGTLYKLEYAHKEHTSGSNYAMNIGFEYSFATDFDMSALLEILKSDNKSNIYQNDIMIGMRFDFANESGTEGIASIIHDQDYHSNIFNINANSRITDNLKIEANLSLVNAKNNDSALRNAIDNFNIALSYFF